MTSAAPSPLPDNASINAQALAQSLAPAIAPTDAPLQRLADQVRAAAAHREPLRIRGGATKDFYGGPSRGQPLDTRELCGISRYDPTEMVITVRAGTALAEVEQALASRGQHLAFEPPRFGAGGTIGGMLACGLSGPARAACGSVRDFVLGATILNGKGELLRFGGQVMKNVAGYDVSRFLAGSLGILGVICEVSLKVPPRPAATQTLSLPSDAGQAIERVNRWTAAALPINASAWHAQVLHVRLAGAVAAVQSASERLRRECGGMCVEPAAAQELWDALRDHRHDFFAGAGKPGQSLWRLSVPATTPAQALGPVPADAMLMEWGGAQRWFHAPQDAAEVRSWLPPGAPGHATLFRAAQCERDFMTPLAAPLEAVHRALKDAFDPAGIFNPGRLYPWL